jgi:uncharacterized protein (TIGR03435 family)
MNRHFTIAAALLITFIVMPASLFAQAPASGAPKPSFDVASIKLNKSGNSSSGSSTRPGGRLTVTNETLRELIREAYVLQDFQVVGGPGWMSSDRFDIAAKGDANPNDDQMRLMLQSLLAERFDLVVHTETKDMPIYALVRAREDGKLGASLTVSDIDCAGPAPRPRPCGSHINLGPKGATIVAVSTSMARLAASLSSQLDRIVLDRTGLAGGFDVDLRWTPEQAADTSGPSLFTALQEQLGLKLESTRGPVEVLVIDRVEPPTAD